MALVVLSFVWIYFFYLINKIRWSIVEEEVAQTCLGRCCIKKLPKPLEDDEIDLDEDVLSE